VLGLEPEPVALLLGALLLEHVAEDVVDVLDVHVIEEAEVALLDGGVALDRGAVAGARAIRTPRLLSVLLRLLVLRSPLPQPFLRGNRFFRRTLRLVQGRRLLRLRVGGVGGLGETDF